MFGNIQSMRAVGKWATLAVMPIMVIAIVMMNRAANANTADPPDSGTLVVASLRDQSITIYVFGAEPESQSLSLAGPPHELAEANGRLYLTTSEPSELVEVLPSLPGVLRTVDLPGLAHGLSTQGGALWVTLDKANELLKLDLETLAVTGRWTTRTTPHAVTVSDDGVVFVVTARADYLTSYGPVAREERTGAFPESVTIVGQRIVTANAVADSLSVFTLQDLTPLGDIALGGSPVRVLAIDDQHLAVSLGESSKVAIVDLERGRVTKEFDVGGRPDGLCLTPDGAFLGVVSNADATVQIRSTENWALAFVVGTADGPGACLWLSEAD